MTAEPFDLARIAKSYEQQVDIDKILKKFPDALKKIEQLETIQGHTYQCKQIALCALFHRSAIVYWSQNKDGIKSNEELEFLGDALIGYFVATESISTLPGLNESHLSRLRSLMAGTKNLAHLTNHLGIGECLMTGQVDLLKPNGEPNSLLADAFEAVSAALFIDAGSVIATAWLRKVFGPDFVKFSENPNEKDEKSHFQEWVQTIVNVRPEYRVVNVIESPTEPSVEVVVSVFDKEIARATGENKKVATQQAASVLMDMVRSEKLTAEILRALKNDVS